MNEIEFNELLDWLAETPAIFERSINGLTDGQLCERPAAEEFSLVEQICHLRDIEKDGYAIRLDRILNEENPQLADLDGSALASERDYLSQDPVVALADFTTARAQNLDRLRTLSLDQLERSGELEGTGQVTLGRLVQMLREHDTIHRGDVAGIVGGFGRMATGLG